MNCPHTVALGGYLLGALEPEDRSTFESHLHGCEICRAELVRLSPLPGLLHQISLEDFEDLPEPDSIPTLVGEPTPVTLTVAEEPIALDVIPAPEPPTARRPRYWLVAAAAALVLVLTIGGIIGYRALQEPTRPAAAGVTWSATDPNTGVHGEATLVERPWGTEVELRLSDLPAGRRCWLVVKDETGKEREVAGWWKTEHQPSEVIPGSTSFAVNEIDRLEVMTGSFDKPDRLVALSPDGHEYPPS